MVLCVTATICAGAQTTPLPAATPPAAPATPQAPCLFTPEELEPVLARRPAAGVARRDARGSACVYAMPTQDVRQVVVLVDERYTAERFEQRVSLAGRLAASPPTMIRKVGDGAFYVAGVAGARRGMKYVEITGLRQSAARVVTAEDAARLLGLALARLPQF